MPPKTSTKPRAPDSRPESPSSWKFDVYAMELPFLSDAYLPEGETEPQFAALHQTIQEY
ncbi:hypothetical protein FB451DRAFT_1418637 [Mycena latifolia]|nr:hypothetical protein FB451DRAFT_1418637 [Mycena latifolia]